MYAKELCIATGSSTGSVYYGSEYDIDLIVTSVGVEELNCFSDIISSGYCDATLSEEGRGCIDAYGTTPVSCSYGEFIICKKSML